MAKDNQNEEREPLLSQDAHRFDDALEDDGGIVVAKPRGWGPIANALYQIATFIPPLNIIGRLITSIFSSNPPQTGFDRFLNSIGDRLAKFDDKQLSEKKEAIETKSESRSSQAKNSESSINRAKDAISKIEQLRDSENIEKQKHKRQLKELSEKANNAQGILSNLESAKTTSAAKKGFIDEKIENLEDVKKTIELKNKKEAAEKKLEKLIKTFSGGKEGSNKSKIHDKLLSTDADLDSLITKQQTLLDGERGGKKKENQKRLDTLTEIKATCEEIKNIDK
ncbi:MAG: hypothetical protein O3B09_01795, partial [Proteobacteria bacterium]|nr:hypothetical protein [Pseudomonadota bacterium]